MRGDEQALSRTQPMRVGQLERRTHDYESHGVTSLVAALDIATGDVLGQCYRRHRSVEFRVFLKKIDAAVPVDLDIHIVLDNCGTMVGTAFIAPQLASAADDASIQFAMQSRVARPTDRLELVVAFYRDGL
jgi:hypothetical protein